jgi:iron-sulfur cluster assembly protein
MATQTPEAPIQEGAPSVEISPRAAQEVLRIIDEQKMPAGVGVRIGVKGGGCSGFTYVMAFDEAPRPTDNVFDRHGARVFVDPKSLLFLAGTTLDFQEGLMGRGFVFSNPKAKRTCGCGSSFSV